jgi:hypothetical protein
VQQQDHRQRQPKSAVAAWRLAPPLLAQHRARGLVQRHRLVGRLIGMGRWPALMFDLQRMNDDGVS